jgi:two-component system cell cycle response regulator DivK
LAALLVLVVDDNETNRKLSRDVLRAAGFGTVEAATGREAIALGACRRPDVILRDLRLPDIDGLDVVRALRNSTETARIPVVALTAARHLSDEAVLHSAGFDGYIAKPIEVRTFPGQVRAFSRERRA